MPSLAELSIQRASLPQFPGTSYVDQLINGRDSAMLVLQKYIPNFAFDVSAADQINREVSVWEERNRSQLSTLLSDPSSSALPEAIRLSLGANKAQAFIVAGFTQAAWGLGPWVSGGLGTAVASGRVQERFAREDAEQRLAVFGSIVKMEQDGYLEKLFVPPPVATNGFGFLAVPIAGSTIVWAVVVAVVAVAAVLIGYLYMSKALEVNNRLMKDLCDEAQKRGDTAIVDACIRESAGLQKPPGLDSLTGGLMKAVAIVGVAFVAIKLLPGLLEGLSKRKRRTT